MNKLTRKTTIYYNKYFIEKTWLLNIYVIQSNEKEKISYNEINQIIESGFCRRVGGKGATDSLNKKCTIQKLQEFETLHQKRKCIFFVVASHS